MDAETFVERGTHDHGAAVFSGQLRIKLFLSIPLLLPKIRLKNYKAVIR